MNHVTQSKNYEFDEWVLCFFYDDTPVCHSNLPLSFHLSPCHSSVCWNLAPSQLSFQRMLESHILTYTRSRDTPGMTGFVPFSDHSILHLVIPAYAGIPHLYTMACIGSRDTPGMTGFAPFSDHSIPHLVIPAHAGIVQTNMDEIPGHARDDSKVRSIDSACASLTPYLADMHDDI
jgi:hypothetical protein